MNVRAGPLMIPRVEAKVVGVIGGMGPEAALDFCARLLRLTPAESDQEHIHVILDNNTAVPDRTRAIFKGGESPLDELVRSARRLEAAGAELLAMPCNTAHAWFDELAAAVRVKLLNMVEAAVAELGDAKTAGLFATEAAVKARVYERAARARGVKLLLPEPEGQGELMKLVRAVKAGRRSAAMRKDLARLSGVLVSRGAKAVILGCTELPLIARDIDGFRLVDSTEILARLTVREAFV